MCKPEAMHEHESLGSRAFLPTNVQHTTPQVLSSSPGLGLQERVVAGESVVAIAAELRGARQVGCASSA